MRLRIEHVTRYARTEPVRRSVQELRLDPAPTRGQRVLSWSVEGPGVESGVSYVDGCGNRTRLVTQADCQDVEVRAVGVVETRSDDGVVGQVRNDVRPRLFLRTTPLTKPDEAIADLVEECRARDASPLGFTHALMAALVERMAFRTGVTQAATTGAAALEGGEGVCQDFAHVMIAAARLNEMPARYVTGYLGPDGAGDIVAEAAHAWAEIDIEGLGWVGFDAANNTCPDQRYVRLACGYDAASAAPVRGVVDSAFADSVEVRVTVTSDGGQWQRQGPGGQSQGQG